jgi:hypothetical protein
MVQMGLQRIVIDGGRLNAAMRFHIDASSAAQDDRGSRFDLQHESEAAVRAQFGPWGAAARMKNTIGYVSTERTITDEQINAQLDLNSSVELVFRTDYIPLERLAGADDVERIQLNTLNPAAGDDSASADHRQSRGAARQGRMQRLETALQPRQTSGSGDPLEVPGPASAPTVPGIRAPQDGAATDGRATAAEGGAGTGEGRTEGNTTAAADETTDGSS